MSIGRGDWSGVCSSKVLPAVGGSQKHTHTCVRAGGSEEVQVWARLRAALGAVYPAGRPAPAVPEQPEVGF